MPEFVRRPGGPVTLKPEHKLISAYYNIDNGGGRLRGIYLQQNGSDASAVVEAIFVYKTAIRDQTLPRKPLLRPELYDRRLKPLQNVMLGAQAPATPAK